MKRTLIYKKIGRLILYKILSRLMFKLVAITTITIGIVTINTINVNAISDYDNAYVNINKMFMQSNSYYDINCDYEDITNSIGTILDDESTYYSGSGRDNVLDSLGEAVANKNPIAYTMQQSIETSGSKGSYYNLLIQWTNEPGAEIDFREVGGYEEVIMTGDKINTITIDIREVLTGSGGCSYKWLGYLSGSIDNVVVISREGALDSGDNSNSYRDGKKYLNNYAVENLDKVTVNYPAGYEGQPVAELPSAIGTAFKPLYTYQVVDKKLTIKDATPNEIIDQYKISLCLMQIPDTELGDTFTEYEYNCRTKPNIEHEFSEYGDYTIYSRMYSEQDDTWYESSEILTIDGSTYTGGNIDFQNCIQESFPFFNMSECINGVARIISLLSFNTINIANYSRESECRNLSTIGTWINKPLYQVCPMVPGTIRNIIDPFIVLSLGLLTLRFFTRRREYI